MGRIAGSRGEVSVVMMLGSWTSLPPMVPPVVGMGRYPAAPCIGDRERDLLFCTGLPVKTCWHDAGSEDPDEHDAVRFRRVLPCDSWW